MALPRFQAGIFFWFVLVLGFIPACGEMAHSVLDWKQAVQARLAVETLWPGTGKLFQGQDPADRSALLEALSTDKSQGMQGGWVAMAKFLAYPGNGGGEADIALGQALRAGQGHPGFLFEGVLVFLQAGRLQRAKQWQALLEKDLLAAGFVRVPDYAKVALAQARRALGQGSKEAALQRIAFAERLDPLSPWIPAARLEAALRGAAPWNWDMGYIWNTLLDIGHLLGYYHNGLPFLFNALHGLRMALQALGFFLLLALLLRYFTEISHGWAERLPRSVDLTWRYAALALLGLSFWVAGIGLLYLAAPLCLLLWKAAKPAERALMRLLLMGLLLLPFGLTLENALLRHLDPKEGLNLYHAAYESGYDPLLVRRIEAFQPGDKTDENYRALALALQHRKLGNTLKAEEYLRQAEANQARHPFLLLQRGNMEMMLQDYSNAEKFYLDAMKAAPTWVETWFNASQAALFQNRSDAHKLRLERAADADAAYLTLFLRQNDESFEETPALRRSMDPMPRFDMALWPALDQIFNLGFLHEVMDSGLLTVPSWAILALALLCMLALAMRQRQNSHVFAGKTTFRCKICGKVMCRHCRKGVHCEPCYKSVVGIQDMRLREELVLRLRQRSQGYKAAIYRSLNTLLPGLGDLFLGLGGMPYVWLMLAVAHWAALWQMAYPLMEYPAPSMGLFAQLPWIPLALVYLAYNAFTFLPGGRRLVSGTRKEIEL